MRTTVIFKVRSLEDILVAFDRKNVGWKMVYNFLGIDEKKIEKSTYIQSEYPYSVFEHLYSVFEHLYSVSKQKPRDYPP